MGVLARDIGDSLAGVRNSFSSWDSCMAKSYCKWPVIAAIILGSLIVLSILFCLSRCLCCGLECCCGCFACCNACCPSPRRRDKGYAQAPPTPHPYQQPPPIQSPYFASGGAGYGGARSVARTATFESPSQKYHEDALPAMPSWSNASSRRIEQYDDDDGDDDVVELDKMDTRVAASAVPPQAQKERLLSHNPNDYSGQEAGSTAELGHRGQEAAVTSDRTNHMQAQPYHDYDEHLQQATSPYGSQRGATSYHTAARVADDSPYGAQNSYNEPDPYATSGYDRNPTAPAAYRSPMSGGYHDTGTTSPLSYAPTTNDYYAGAQAPAPIYAQPNPYESSTSPPSYRSDLGTPGVLTPGGGVERKPVQGSWRAV